MYCDKCHKRNPNNFETCAYCGAKLSQPKKEKPQKFIKNKKFSLNLPIKPIVFAAHITALVLIIVSIFVASFSGAKSEKVVKNFVKAINTQNEKLYFSLYDSNLIKYKKDNRYFGDEETYKQIVEPIYKSDEFYKEKCGDKYSITYYINGVQQLKQDELKTFTDVLRSGFNYVDLPTKVDKISLEIIAKGSEGEYKSVYSDFWCMKIKGRWYKVDKNIYTEYLNFKLAT